MITKAQAIASLRDGSEWVLRGDDLEWLDQTQTQPTEAEIAAEVARLTALEPARIATKNRRNAYIAEADALFFKAQRGADRGFRVHVGNLHVRLRSKAATLVNQVAEQLIQDGGRFFVRQEANVVA